MVRIQPGHYGASRTCCCLLPPLRRAHSFPCESPHTVIDDSMRSVHGVSTAQVMNNYSGYERLQPKIPLPRGLSSAQAHHRITLRTRYLSTVTVADFTSATHSECPTSIANQLGSPPRAPPLWPRPPPPRSSVLPVVRSIPPTQWRPSVSTIYRAGA